MTDLHVWVRRSRPQVKRLTAGVQVRDAGRRRREFSKATDLGALFIENVKYKPTLHVRARPHDGLYAKEPSVVSEGAQSIRLQPVADLSLQTTLQQALLARESNRNYSGESVTIEQLSYLLELGAGTNEGVAETVSSRRTYPSGGQMYPCEIFLIARCIEQVPESVYLFDPSGHRIVRHVDRSANLPRELDRYFAPAAALVVLIVVDIEVMLLRYEELAYKLSLLEAGHIAQNFVLIGAALGLCGCTLCYFPDDTINAMLRIDGRRRFVCYAIEFGRRGEKGRM